MSRFKAKVAASPAYRNDPGGVIWFSAYMFRALQDHNHRSSWQGPDAANGTPTSFFLRQLRAETRELKRAIRDKDPQQVIPEAADVANFAFMLADRARIKIERGPQP